MRPIFVGAAAALLTAVAIPAMAQTAAPSGPATAPAAPGAGSAASALAPAAQTLAVGLPVKDKTGATIGEIADLKADNAGGQTATVKMGEQSFAIGAQSFVVQNGAAVINATQAELKAMIAKAGAAG